MAIGMGIIFGFAVAVFIWKSSFFTPKKEPEPQPKTVISPAPVFSLTLNSPKNELFTTEKEATVAGRAQGASLVIISGNSEDQVTETLEDGAFEAIISLEEGPNEIQVTAYGPKSEEVSEFRIVNYSKEEL